MAVGFLPCLLIVIRLPDKGAAGNFLPYEKRCGQVTPVSKPIP